MVPKGKPQSLPRAVVIVDPFSSGGDPFIEDLRESGALIISILSSRLLGSSWIAQWNPALYDVYLEHTNMEDTVAFIKSLNVDVKAIFPGSEPGVSLAEDLREYFEDVGKNAGPSDVRRHKHTMHKALRKNGVRGIVECLTDDVDKAIEWVMDKMEYPVIVKPPMSGGTDGLFFCHTNEDVREAFATETNKLNVNGVMNSELLVQEFLDGTEYVVDAISHEGRHLIVAIWRYNKLRNKETKAITYEYSDFLPCDGPEQDQLREYTVTALDALGVRFGASHNEIIIDSRGPCLVESGARLHGGFGAQACTIATGTSPVALLTDIALYDARVFNELYRVNRYILKQYCLFVDLYNSENTGILVKSIGDELEKLLTTIRQVSAKEAGDKVEVTRDMATSPGNLLICHPSKKFLMEEYAKLRELEADDLYMVMEDELVISDDIAEDPLSSDEAHTSALELDSSEFDSGPESLPLEVGMKKSMINDGVDSRKVGMVHRDKDKSDAETGVLVGM